MSKLPWHDDDRANKLIDAMNTRILLLDGAMGTMIQQHDLGEDDFRGDILADHDDPMKGNNDILSLTRPELIRQIHEDFLDAGCDLVETNTFNANRVSQADYSTEHLVGDINRDSAKLAREACDKYEKKDASKPRFVVGVLGPTNRTASISPDVTNPGYRNTNFDELYEIYMEATEALLDGGVDAILIETVFDTLNAKAAGYAVNDVFRGRGQRWPLMISGTITDASGRTLSGQTPEAFYYSIDHTDPISVGFNCALGADQLKQHVEALSKVARCYISAHPNAGLPNEFGEYDESPEDMAHEVAEYAADGLVNILGGCCGTTPDHLRAIGEAIHSHQPRKQAA